MRGDNVDGNRKVTLQLQCIPTVNELLCVQHHYLNLDTFSIADVADIMIETQCTT